MSDLHAYDNKVWDRLFDLLYAQDEVVADSELDAELRQANIDMRPAFRRLHEMIEEKQARKKLARAQQIRVSITEKLRHVVSPKVSDMRAGVREFIDRVFSGPEHVAHYHKLERAATDEDLESLLNDLTRLAELRRTEEENGPKTE